MCIIKSKFTIKYETESAFISIELGQGPYQSNRNESINNSKRESFIFPTGIIFNQTIRGEMAKLPILAHSDVRQSESDSQVSAGQSYDGRYENFLES